MDFQLFELIQKVVEVGGSKHLSRKKCSDEFFRHFDTEQGCCLGFIWRHLPISQHSECLLCGYCSARLFWMKAFGQTLKTLLSQRKQPYYLFLPNTNHENVECLCPILQGLAGQLCILCPLRITCCECMLLQAANLNPGFEDDHDNLWTSVSHLQIETPKCVVLKQAPGKLNTLGIHHLHWLP